MLIKTVIKHREPAFNSCNFTDQYHHRGIASLINIYNFLQYTGSPVSRIKKLVMNRIYSISAALFFSLYLLYPLTVTAQVSFGGDEMRSEFNRAMELFSREKYPAAIRLFDSFLEKENSDPLLEAEAEYYSSLAALRLFNADAEYRMLNYLARHPESPRLNESRLEIADFFYQTKNYRKAASYYELVDRFELEGEKLAEYFFRLGYSLYSTGNNPRALLMFSEIKDIDTEYTPPAIYYYSHIAYEQKMYESAVEGFMKLRDDETFGRVVPFYIVQILYLKKDYDGILEVAPGLLSSAGKDRATEIYRFIGDAYYNKGNYAEALSYLERYVEASKTTTREDRFQLGYCYYMTGNTEEAIKTLLSVSARNDVLSQNIWNILGDCYLTQNNKERARFAFGEASKLEFDRTIREQALFNYAKLTYEISSSPFGEAIEAFERFIDLFPGSEKIQEAYDYLVGTYTQVKNYRAALASLDRVRNKDSRLETAYQKVAFYRGLELFRNQEFGSARDMLSRSLEYEKYNRTLKARATYWRGEANYRLGRYDEARSDYELFIGLPGSGQLSESGLIRYNLGSVYFNLQDYTSALSHFKAFESGSSKAGAEVLADTRNRIADCYFIGTDYRSAISYYDQVINMGVIDSDYAMFQKGFSLGLMRDDKGKAGILTDLLQKYPSSPLAANAVFERGRAYISLQDFRRGEADFNTVISSYTNSPFVPRAIVQLGLLYYNLGENDKAVAQFKKVIESYKATPEARYAMTGLRNAYVDMNDVESYFAYAKSQDGYGDINATSRDSLLYTSGENLYMTSRFEKAEEVFRNYLRDFPAGIFRQNAQFYLAETLRRANKTDEALKLYEEVAARPNNQFTEPAVISAAEILFSREEYERAYAYYERLETAATSDDNKLTAMRGQLRSASEAGDAQKTIAAASKIMARQGVQEELLREAIFMNARARYSLNDYDEALRDYRRVATEVTTEEGAEAKFMVAQLLHMRGQTTEAEKVIQEFIDQNTPHQYWMARIFLLLSDISIGKGDNIQARATLQSLRDYYSVKDDGILDEVRRKLDAISDEN
jgi:TolA-binding protein